MLAAALNGLQTATGALFWVLTALLCALVVFVGVTLAVALFHPDESRRADARMILLDLFDFLRGGRSGRGQR